MTEPEKTYGVRSVDKAIDLLTALADADGPLALTQLAEAVGGSKSAIFSTLQTLRTRGFVLSVGSGLERRYQLGLELARIGDLAMQRFSLGAIARPVLEALTRETGLTSRAAVLENGCAVAVGRVDGRGGVRFDLQMGQRELLHCSSVGKAMLSTFDDDEVLRLVGPAPWHRRTGRTLTTPAQLLPDIADTRERGYSVDDEEDAEGILCIGAPVFDGAGECQGAISITRIKGEVSAAETARIGEVVVRFAQVLSAQLNGSEN